MKALIMFAVCFTAIAGSRTDTLTGRWQSKPSDKGNVTSVLFKEDNNFEGYVNRKPFTTGKYTLKDDIFSFTDNGCNGALGTYKIIFFSNADSMRFEPINDTCIGRKEGMKRLILGKVK